MKSVIAVVLSILTGVLSYYHQIILVGINPFLIKLLMLSIAIVLGFNIFLIRKMSKPKSKLLYSIILVCSIIFSFVLSEKEMQKELKNSDIYPTRTYEMIE
jgi:hypothetical protein